MAYSGACFMPDHDASPPMAPRMQIWVATISVIWYAVIWSIGLLGWHTAKKRYRIRPRSPLATLRPDQVPGVSIIRPLKGLDPNMFENLESTFTQDYPKFEILFSVADENDQALAVVRDLITRYPAVDASIVIGDEAAGVNPKINNLIRPYKLAKYDIIWVLDSNVQVTHGTLARGVDILNPPERLPTSAKNKHRIGLVHHVPLAFSVGSSTGARLEEAFLNTNHAKMYLAINTLAIESCVMGKSNMYRRSDIDRLSATMVPMDPGTMLSHPSEQRGLPAFGRYLAEDNMIGRALWMELGLRHDLSCDVALNAVGDMDFQAYVWRRVRWIRVRKHMVIAATLVEPFTESLVVGLLGAWAIRTFTDIPAVLLFPFHMILWLSVDLDVYAKLSGDAAPTSGYLPFLRAWIFREILALPLWILGMVGNQVFWRGGKFKVLQNGEVYRVDDAR